MGASSPSSDTHSDNADKSVNHLNAGMEGRGGGDSATGVALVGDCIHAFPPDLGQVLRTVDGFVWLSSVALGRKTSGGRLLCVDRANSHARMRWEGRGRFSLGFCCTESQVITVGSKKALPKYEPSYFPHWGGGVVSRSQSCVRLKHCVTEGLNLHDLDPSSRACPDEIIGHPRKPFF